MERVAMEKENADGERAGDREFAGKWSRRRRVRGRDAPAIGGGAGRRWFFERRVDGVWGRLRHRRRPPGRGRRVDAAMRLATPAGGSPATAWSLDAVEPQVRGSPRTADKIDFMEKNKKWNVDNLSHGDGSDHTVRERQFEGGLGRDDDRDQIQ